MLNYFATCAKGLESLLFEELKKLGASDVKQTLAGCYFRGDQALGYRACLWSRMASRVLLYLDKQPVLNRDELLQAAANIDWPTIFSDRATFAVDFRGTNHALKHTQFSARVVKDGIVDRFREDQHGRPNVDPDQPDLRVNVRLAKDVATFYLDLSGESLHKRGYRVEKGAAPLRETLAAAVVERAGVSELTADTPATILDLFAGSGTLLLEAALVLTDRAPGLARERWGFEGWRGHRPRVWHALKQQAIERFETARQQCAVRFVAVDLDKSVLQAAKHNAEQLDVAHLFEFHAADALTFPATTYERGVVLSNPPYGERLGAELEVLLLFRQLGQRLREHYLGWRVGVLAPEEVLLKRLKLTSERKYKLYNGAIPVTLALFDMTEAQVEFTKTHDDAVANRLRKNAQKLGKWARKEGVDCYRLYDADIPEYNAAIDIYGDYLVVQEYAAPADIPAGVADDRFWHLLETIPAVLPFNESQMVVKQRKRQQGKAQYEKQEAAESIECIVHEYNAQFKVNLSDYLDSGLFLDHRVVRREIQRMAAGKTVLNLFAYTGTASVHAGLGGAEHITTVDLSRTYLNWAKDNFRLNHVTISKHDFIQADCLSWLSEQAASQSQQWDLVFLDPPTFSNSKRMEDNFDVQRDHLALIVNTSQLVKPGGTLIFSTNKRKFKMDTEALQNAGLVVEDRTAWSISEDFKRNKHIHQCWFIRHA